MSIFKLVHDCTWVSFTSRLKKKAPTTFRVTVVFASHFHARGKPIPHSREGHRYAMTICLREPFFLFSLVSTIHSALCCISKVCSFPSFDVVAAAAASRFFMTGQWGSQCLRISSEERERKCYGCSSGCCRGSAVRSAEKRVRKYSCDVSANIDQILASFLFLLLLFPWKRMTLHASFLRPGTTKL